MATAACYGFMRIRVLNFFPELQLSIDIYDDIHFRNSAHHFFSAKTASLMTDTHNYYKAAEMRPWRQLYHRNRFPS
jgi:hypothetical protein